MSNQNVPTVAQANAAIKNPSTSDQVITYLANYLGVPLGDRGTMIGKIEAILRTQNNPDPIARPFDVNAWAQQNVVSPQMAIPTTQAQPNPSPPITLDTGWEQFVQRILLRLLPDKFADKLTVAYQWVEKNGPTIDLLQQWRNDTKFIDESEFDERLENAMAAHRLKTLQALQLVLKVMKSPEEADDLELEEQIEKDIMALAAEVGKTAASDKLPEWFPRFKLGEEKKSGRKTTLI